MSSEQRIAAKKGKDGGDQDSRMTQLSPEMQVNRFLWPGAFGAQTICVAAKLGIADLLASGPDGFAGWAGMRLRLLSSLDTRVATPTTTGIARALFVAVRTYGGSAIRYT